MTELPLIDDYRRLFLEDVPMLDVRAPVEFAAGSFPLASNHPLLDDQQRHDIGIRYKEAGQDAAVQLGLELADDQIRQQRIAAWRAFAEKNPNGVLYCFRGGMRSGISQQWLYEQTGIIYPRVRGGYKAMRRFLLEELDAAADHINPLVIGGRTGVGKTLMLRRLKNTLDLEALAWHRGSAFGHHATPQPTAIDFENALSIALLKHRSKGNMPLIIEDESKHIGSRHLPDKLYKRFKRSPLVILQATVEERVENTLQEYVHDTLLEYEQLFGLKKGFDQWAAYALTSLDKVKKRLGGERHRRLRTALETALGIQRTTAQVDAHRGWIRELLTNYYDPMYDYQITNNKDRIVFQGDADAVAAYLQQKSY